MSFVRLKAYEVANAINETSTAKSCRFKVMTTLSKKKKDSVFWMAVLSLIVLSCA